MSEINEKYIPHSHYCIWCNEDTMDDCFVCNKCAEKHTLEETNERLKKMGEIKQVIKEFEKVNEDLCKEVKELPQHKWNDDEMNDTKYLMSVVSGILQFLEYKFPNALDIRERPIQRIIFQNARYRLYKRMNKIREKK